MREEGSLYHFSVECVFRKNMTWDSNGCWVWVKRKFGLQGLAKVMERSRQGQGKVKARSKQGQGQVKRRSGQVHGKVKERFWLGKSKVKEWSRQGREARLTTVIASMSIR